MNAPTSTSWASTALGLDENGGVPILVKAVRRGRSLSFSNSSLTEATVSAPKTVLSACLLHRESFTRWLTAPIASPRKAETVFHSLLDIQLPFSVEDCELALLETKPTADRTGTRGLVAGARQEDIEKKLVSLAESGFAPQLLDQESITLWYQALSEFPPLRDDAPVRVVVYLGADRMTVVAGESGEFMGANSMRQPDAEAIHRFLKSHFSTPPQATQWLWTGPGATPSAVESLYQVLAGRWPGNMKIVRDPATFLARALAARALTGGPGACNLRTGRLLHPDLARKQERQPYILAGACLAAGLLLCLVNIAWLAAVHHRIISAQSALRALASEVSGNPRRLPAGQEVLAARRDMEQQTKDMEPFLAAVVDPLQDSLSMILTAASEEGLKIERLTLGNKNGAIHGLALKLEQGEKLAQRLNAAGWTSNIERKETPPGEERTAFVIGMERKHEKK